MKHRVPPPHRPTSSSSVLSSSSKTTEEKQWGSSPNAPEELFKQLGETINTRWNEISEKELREMQEQEEVDVFDEKKRSLMEEARLAAGTRQRPVAAPIREYLHAVDHEKKKASSTAASSSATSSAPGGVPLVRIHHNSNSITAVAALGSEAVVMSDKSGKVYVVTLAPSSPTATSVAEASHRHQGSTTSGEGKSHLSGSTQQERGAHESIAAAVSSVSSSSTSALVQRKHLLFPIMASGVVSLAVSDTRDTFATMSARSVFERTTVDTSCTSYIAAGCRDGSISIWELQSKNHKGLLWLHREPVMGLRFRPYTSTLLSVSADGTLRMWSVPEMMSVDQFFGHEGSVHDCDGLRRNACVTVGEDGTMRYWKLDAATQQAYPYVKEQTATATKEGGASTNVTSSTASAVKVSLESVTMLNESIVVAGSRDGALVLFDTNRRRPVVVKSAAHGYDFVGDGTGLEKVSVVMNELMDSSSSTSPLAAALAPPSTRGIPPLPNPITAVAAVPYGDVVATGSYDGCVRLWEVKGVGSGATAAGRRRADEVESTGSAQEDSLTKTSSAGSTGPEFSLIAAIPISGMINSLKFNWTGDVLFIGAAKEPRGGRWIVQQRAWNAVYVVPLRATVGLQALRSGSGDILHIPAELYGLKELEEAGEPEQSEDEEKEKEEEANEEEDDEEVESNRIKANRSEALGIQEKRKLRFSNADEEEEALSSSEGDEQEEEYYSFKKEKKSSDRKNEAKPKKRLLEMSEDGAMIVRKGMISPTSFSEHKKKKKKVRPLIKGDAEAMLPSALKGKEGKGEKERKKKKKINFASQEEGGETTAAIRKLYGKVGKKDKLGSKKSNPNHKAKKEASVKTKKTLKR